MFDLGGFSQLLGVWKETKRHQRDKHGHQHNGDRIIIARIRIILHSLQRALRSSKIIKRAGQHNQYEFADELFVVQVADSFILQMKNQSLLVASMRMTFCSSASDRYVFSSSLSTDWLSGGGTLARNRAFPGSKVFSQVFFSRRKKRSEVSHAKWR